MSTRRALVKKICHEIPLGEPFRVTAIPRNPKPEATGEDRVFNCEKRELPGKPLYDPSSYALCTIWDLDKNGWRNINLDGVTSLTWRGHTEKVTSW